MFKWLLRLWWRLRNPVGFRSIGTDSVEPLASWSADYAAFDHPDWTASTLVVDGHAWRHYRSNDDDEPTQLEEE